MLKAAHHGSESGYSESAVAWMSPSLVICSVGEKPETDASVEYRAQGAEVLSTRYNGTIIVTIEDDGGYSIANSTGDVVASASTTALASR